MNNENIGIICLNIRKIGKMGSNEMYQLLEERIDGYRKVKRTKRDDCQRKAFKEVFDNSTLMVLYKMITKGYLDTIDYPISTGKEGNVFKATDRDGNPLVAKIFRTTAVTFKNIMKYIEGNPRYRNVGGNRRQLIFTWARKEFDNLSRMRKYGIRAPIPYYVDKNIIIMEYIGNDISPAPLLKAVPIPDPDKFYLDTIDTYFRMFNEAKLVHSDLSEYNILVGDNMELIWIDVGQAVILDHHMSYSWLVRDIKNISKKPC